MADKVGIRFTQNCPPYNDGDSACFSAHKAKGYVDAGMAVLAFPEQHKEVVEKAVPPVDKHPSKDRGSRKRG